MSGFWSSPSSSKIRLGVQAVNIDAGLGKVTVTGTVDSKLLLKKLQKAGKFAEVLAATPASDKKGKDFQKDQSKVEKKENKKVRFQDIDDGAKKNEWVKPFANRGGKSDMNSSAGNDSVVRSSDAMGDQSVKNKKGGDGFGSIAPSMSTAQRNIAPRMIEASYSGESAADFATHMFSEENAQGCLIM